jgi:hypothetical protein
VNKIYLILAVLIFTTAKSIFAFGDFMVKKIVLNGKARAASISTHKQGDTLFLEAQSLARALGFTLKRPSDLAILCTEQACLPFTIGEKEVVEKDGKLFISAKTFFTSVGGDWELNEKINTLTVDLSDELPTNNAPVGVTVGSTAPGFRVIDANGKEIRLADFLGKKNVVMEFFRSGSW